MEAHKLLEMNINELKVLLEKLSREYPDAYEYLKELLDEVL